MSNVFTTEAICLNRKKIDSTSCYLTLFTRKMGVIEVYTYGANNPKSPLNKGAQPFVYGKYVLSGKKSFKLKEVDIIDNFYSLREDYNKFLDVSFLSKIVLSVMIEGSNNKNIYEMFVNSIYIIRKNDDLYNVLLNFFIVKICKYMGILPYVSENNRNMYLNIEGDILLKNNIDSISILKIYDILVLDIISYLKVSKEDVNILEFFERYIDFHLNININKIRKKIEEFK